MTSNESKVHPRISNDELQSILNKRPKELDLSGNKLTDEQVRMIVDSQKTNPTITSLDISPKDEHGIIGADGYNALAELVRTSRTLVSLKIKGNLPLNCKGKIGYRTNDEPSTLNNAMNNLENALMANPNILSASIDNPSYEIVLSPNKHTHKANYETTKLAEKLYDNKIQAYQYIAKIAANPDTLNTEQIIDIKNRMGLILYAIESDDIVSKKLNVFFNKLLKLDARAKEIGIVTGSQFDRENGIIPQELRTLYNIINTNMLGSVNIVKSEHSISVQRTK